MQHMLSFKGCRVLICDFHREQAWLRWTRKTDNKVGAHREDLLALMRAVAKVESQDDYKTALGRLQRHAGWTSNVKFQKYFNNIWLDHKQRWLSLYRHDQLHVMINTNNGVERQNRLLKDTHLCHRTDKSLSGLITTLHEDFLPNSFLKYTQENAFSSERYRKYNEIIPTYLHNRPHQLVKHCMKRIRNAEDISASFVTENSTGFAVKSASNPSESYQVSFTNSNDFPKCSCEDFQRHFLMIFPNAVAKTSRGTNSDVLFSTTSFLKPGGLSMKLLTVSCGIYAESTMQTDGSSCGVLVCLYARLIMEEKSLCTPGPIATLRREIYDSIVGSCLSGKQKDKKKCPLCKLDNLDDWVQCCRCKQWMHCTCARIDLREAKCADFITCPRASTFCKL